MTDSMTPRQLALWNRCSANSDNEGEDPGVVSDNSCDTDEEWLSEIILSHVASIPIPRPISIHGAEEISLVPPLSVPAIMRDVARVEGALAELEPETDLKLALPVSGNTQSHQVQWFSPFLAHSTGFRAPTGSYIFSSSATTA